MMSEIVSNVILNIYVIIEDRVINLIITKNWLQRNHNIFLKLIPFCSYQHIHDVSSSVSIKPSHDHTNDLWPT